MYLYGGGALVAAYVLRAPLIRIVKGLGALGDALGAGLDATEEIVTAPITARVEELEEIEDELAKPHKAYDVNGNFIGDANFLTSKKINQLVEENKFFPEFDKGEGVNSAWDADTGTLSSNTLTGKFLTLFGI